MYLTHRRLTAIVVVTVSAACACAWAAGPASARPAAAQRTVRCSLPHAKEGGFALPYFATNLSCAQAKPVVAKAEFFQAGCKLTSPAGCKNDGFVCRDAKPEAPGEANPGDIIRCTRGPKAIKFEEPG
jgi:hypothetical protein